ncbi:hypothetical protein FEM48_Zijuj11G0033600 [Ziziphus jujuba var. spinosa]|uniref:Protein TRM32-like n=1 Tax=Ziziphus jujuba var. spinosa TaxID=714518 RepID=A0A978UGI5_ZIZJJ|nr:uncharacterized protein LOC107429856 [Ziziphus jujuba var. spinosa]KAH7513916.1 hypothetical protein FEM48_Zijuj11G0033600 [Ziziphus jujuba var. spinosa]
MTRLTPPKSPVVSKKKSGCMWGLYSLFDFRQGRSDKKLISYRKGLKKHVVGERNLKRHDLLDKLEGKCQGIDDKSKSLLDPDIQNEKKLKGDEISTMQQINLVDPDMQSSSKGTCQLAKNNGKARKNCQRPCHVTLHGQAEAERHKQPSQPNSMDRFSNKIDSAATKEISFKQSRPKKRRGFGCRNVDFVAHSQVNNLELVQMKDAVEAVVNQKFIDGKYLSSNGVNQQSKQLLDALQILNKNKELFTKLLQDPNSLLVKHIQNLKDSQTTKQQRKSFSEAKISEYHQTDCARQYEEPACTEKSKASDNFQSKGRNDPQFSETITVLKPDLTTIQNSAGETNHCTSLQSYNSLEESAKNVRITYFPFGRVTRKLRHAMGVSKKDQQLLSTNVMNNRSPYECKRFEDGHKGKGREITRLNSPTIMHVDNGEMAKSSNDIWKRDKIDKLEGFKSSTGHETASSSQSSFRSSNLMVFSHYKKSESDMDLEALKHPSEVLKTKSMGHTFSQSQTPKTWQRKTDFFRIPSPVRDSEHGSIMEDMRFVPYRSCQLVYENKWKFQKEQKERCSSSLKRHKEAPPDNKQPNNQLQLFDTKSNISETSCAPTKVIEVDSGFKGCVKILEAIGTIHPEERNPMEVPAEPDGTDKISTFHGGEANPLGGMSKCDSIGDTYMAEANDIIHTASSNEEYEHFRCFKQDSSFDDQPSTSSVDDVSSSTPSSIETVPDPDTIEDRRHQSSPISVLEPFFTDETSPESTLCNSAEDHSCSALSMSPLNPKISSATCLDYGSIPDNIRELLQMTGINWDELLKKFHEADQLLELDLSSLLDTAKVQANQSCDNHRLIIDCIKDVLLKVYHSHFRFSHWVSLTKPNFQTLPVEKFVIHEITKCIDWHLLKQPSPITLEELVVKDLTRCGTWLDIQNDVEDIVVETVEDALEELIMETILELQI